MGYRRVEAAPSVLDLVMKQGIEGTIRAAHPLPVDAHLVYAAYNSRWNRSIVLIFESQEWDGRVEFLDAAGVPLLDPEPLFLRERSVV